MKKVLVVVGPTAIGKSAFGVKLAKLFNGQIISGDSIQVYKGLDIGSGKITEEEKQGIPHYGIDCLSPYSNYSVFDFQKMARFHIDNISDAGSLPMIVGGTGLYIKACLYDYVFEENLTLDLTIYEAFTNEQLVKRLDVVDPKSLETIHINNRKRLIRALAMAEQATSKSDLADSQMHQPIYDILVIGLTSDREVVYQRINQRVEQMIEQGLVKEIQSLLADGLTFEHQSMQAIGYREFKPYFDQEATLEQVIENIQRNTRRFAKRQYTWFNNQIAIKWFDIEHLETAIQEVKQWKDNTNESH